MEDVSVSFDGVGSSDPESGPLTYAWDFGDGNTGTGMNPGHAYTAGGAYTVTLVVNDGVYNSAPVSTTATVTEVNDPPTADPGGPYDGTEGTSVPFYGSGSSDPEGSPLNYAWDFGDGGTGSGTDPSHTYNAGGVYTVTLVVNDGDADSLLVDTTATITAVNDPPTADPGGPYTGTEDVSVSFDGVGSSDPESGPLTYAWDFGDGNTGTGVNPSHAYLAGGIYTVTLIVNDGASDSAPMGTTADITEVNDRPVADPGGPYEGTEDVSVSFSGSASWDLEGSDLTYAWDFGDGSFGDGMTPNHTYSVGGIYTVTLVVNDGDSASLPVDATATIADVNDPPTADPGVPYTGTEDVSVSFDGSGSSDPESGPLTYAWDFGDGNSGTGVNPSHTYTGGGVYTVTLVVNDGVSDSAPVTTTADITEVNDVPVADPGGTYNCTEGSPVAMDGSGSWDLESSTLNYDWDFGDGSSGTGVVPSHTYASGGVYTVTLVVNDGTDDSPPVTTTATIASALEASDMHVHDLDAFSQKMSKGNWKSVVTIVVLDANDVAVDKAFVEGTFFQNGYPVFAGSCTTDSNGECVIVSDQFPNKSGKGKSFVVQSVTGALDYDSGANHDFDDDSDGTTIVLSK